MAFAPSAAQSKSVTAKKSTATVGKSSAATVKSKTGSSSQAKKTTKSKRSKKKTGRSKAGTRAARAARTASIRRAFVASTELRPMAQQLATMRTPEAFAGVAAYARRNTGEAAAAAYLALGHAYLLDHRYADAVTNLRLSRKAGDDLADYADFLGAEASQSAGDNQAAEVMVHGFADRYPDSVFNKRVPELEAQILLALGRPADARTALAAGEETDAADRLGFKLAQGQVALALGETAAAERIFKDLLAERPLSEQAQTAFARLKQMGAETTLTLAELRSLADAYYNAGRYTEAAEEYRALERTPGLGEGARNGFTVAEAACELKLKRLTLAKAKALPDTDDESGARRLGLLMELARDRDSTEDQRRIVAEMQTRFPHSPWLEQALLSSGNMYLLKRDYASAAEYYLDLATRFPEAKKAAAAHWRAGWLTYRQARYEEAARIFDEQIHSYPTATESVSALYWRARLHESLDHNIASAAADYRMILRNSPHYFYAQMARQRLTALGSSVPAEDRQQDHSQKVAEPQLVESFPEASPHLAKARLLANVGLNEYIAQEIKADPDASSSGSLAEAQIYSSYGQTSLALRTLKRALPNSTSAQLQAIPLVYWRILFPEPWWETIQSESAKNHLDPYLVASLIRQESEFNPMAISRANAYGLMQLLPSVGRKMAREESIARFETYQLLNPEVNIRLGTRYLKQMLDRFGGVEAYALAAYNAGDSRVVDWQAAGPYQGLDEFVESIPFTETREYVQAILRNKEMYQAIDAFDRAQTSEAAKASP
jgi:soluble lytic murein transglycosylase